MVCLIIPIPEPSPYQHPGPRGSKWKRRPAAYPPTRQPPNQRAAGSGLLGASQLSLRTECAYPPSPHKPPLLPTSPLRPSPGPRGSVLAPLPIIPSPNQPFQLPTSHFPLPSPCLPSVPRWSGRTRQPRATLRVVPTPETIPSIRSIRSIRSTRSIRSIRSTPVPKTLTPTRPLPTSPLFPQAPFYYLLFTISNYPPAPGVPVQAARSPPAATQSQRSGQASVASVPPTSEKNPTVRCTASPSPVTAPTASIPPKTSSITLPALSPRSSPMPTHHGNSLPIRLIRIPCLPSHHIR